jgi:ankyrin repeat protein
LTKYREEAETLQNLVTNERFSFDFLDVNLNSPLHIASQEGHPNCIEILLNDYNLSYDLRNIDGWMSKDIVQ